VISKNYFVVISAVLCLGVADCAGVPPEWHVDLYSGDVSRRALVRCISPPNVDPCQDWDLMPADDPRFDEMVAMKWSKLLEREKQIMQSCKKWGPVE